MAEGIALLAIRVGEGAAIGVEYLTRDEQFPILVHERSEVSSDKQALSSAHKSLARAENALRSAQDNLMRQLENNGKSQQEGAQEGLQAYRTQQSKIAAIENNLASIMGDIAQNGNQPSAKKSA